MKPSITDRPILWLVPKWPLPAQDGARQATTQLLRGLAKLGAEIHLCALVTPDETPNIEEAKAQLGVKSVLLVPRTQTRGLKAALRALRQPQLPITLGPFATQQISGAISKWVQTYTKPMIVHDGLHAGAWTLNQSQDFTSKCTLFYRAHNVEGDLWKRSAQQSQRFWMKQLLKYQAKLIGSFELKLSRESRAVFPVSEVDSARFRELVPSTLISTTPIGMSIPNGQPTAFAADRTLLFVGKLDWPPNRDGLIWFLKEVWPEVSKRSQDIKLKIIGSTDGSWLKDYIDQPRIDFLGRVPELGIHYQNSMASLVPIFFGSGTRVKAIESCLMKRACISTDMGVEGMGLKAGTHYLSVHTAQEWIEAIGKLTLDEAEGMGNRAFEYAVKQFDPDVIARKFLDTLIQ